MDALKTGGLIVQVRKEKELTQKDLAERLHVSAQAVSKWERGLNCPDIALLEPLAEVLELTVTELLSGQRGEEPHEELVRDSLRVGENQLRPKIKWWRGLFLLTAALLLMLVLWLGCGWLQDNTRLLPQRETVITPVDITDREQIMVKVLSGGNSSLYLYDVVVQDGLSRWYVQMELVVSGEVERSWVLGGEGLEDSDWTYPRRQLLALGVKPKDYNLDDSNGSLEYTLCFDSCTTSSTVEDIPHLTGGAVLNHEMREKAVVDPEEGAILLVWSVQGLDNYWHPWGTSLVEGTAFLVFRLYCE